MIMELEEHEVRILLSLGALEVDNLRARIFSVLMLSMNIRAPQDEIDDYWNGEGAVDVKYLKVFRTGSCRLCGEVFQLGGS